MEEEIREKIEGYLLKKGLRRTRQREVVVEAAFSTDDHFTADQLWERARAIDPSVSRATLYRTLNLLVECDALREIDLGGNQKHYDPNFHAHPNHSHLICTDCRKVVEFEDDHINLLEDCITRRLGFKPKNKMLRIEASCQELKDRGVCERADG
ncbi:MAG: transcriptional repressor [Verrucomicrobiales bacterium]